MRNVKFKFLTTTLIACFLAFSACNQQPKGIQATESDDVGVYYFHTNARCVTCRTIEAEARQDISDLFGDDVRFMTYNLDEKEGLEKGKGLGVNSQMLVIVKGDRKINITNEGFLYARTNPEKFKQVLEEKIKPLL